MHQDVQPFCCQAFHWLRGQRVPLCLSATTVLDAATGRLLVVSLVVATVVAQYVAAVADVAVL